MPRSVGYNRGSRVRSRRSTSWGVGVGGSLPSVFVASSTAILGSGVVIEEDGSTIVRIRGSLQAFLSVQDAAGSGYHCALGICLVNDDAFGIGVTAIPDPVDDVSFDGWIYHRFFDVHAVTATEADGSNAVAAAVQFEVDSKAMRKWDDFMTLVAVLQVVENGAATLQVFFDSRMLVKNP